MLRRAEFPPIDLDSIGLLPFAENSAPALMGAGFNSHVWRGGMQVMKTSKTPMSHDGAEQLRATMQYEHAILEDFIGEYIPDTTYATADRQDGIGAHVVAVQPFIEGVHLLDHWRSGRGLGAVHLFFERCLKVYDKTGLMPDIGNFRTVFNPVRSRNLLVVDDEPVLVDPTFGSIQRSEMFGSSWTRGIYVGTLVAQKRLELRSK